VKKRAVFLDRDGTINRDVGYPNSYGLIEIFPYSFDAVRKINTSGFLAVVVTNQSGVGRGLIDEKNLKEIHQKMEAAFAEHSAHFDGIYYCPHFLSSTIPAYRKDCTCRKPLPGMARQAAADLDIDTEHSYMIGDKVEDIEFGLNIKAQPILLLTGFGRKSLTKLKEKNIKPVHVASNLLAAVDWILKNESAAAKD
jgi:D-glycero-D-manno-heptose 1,7-bisphosphate phosphatase